MIAAKTVGKKLSTSWQKILALTNTWLHITS